MKTINKLGGLQFRPHVIRTLFLVFSLHTAIYAAAAEEPSPNIDLANKALECVKEGRLDEALKIDLGVVANLRNEKDLEVHVQVYNDLGVIYRRLNKNDSAIYYYDKAFNSAIKLDDKEWLTTLACNLAVFYHNLRHFQDAERYADMAVKYSKDLEDESYKFLAYQVAAPMKTEMKKLDEALRYAREAWAMADSKDGDDEMRMRCIPSLTAVFDELGQTDSVFHYINIGNRLLDGCKDEITRIGYIQNRGDMYFRHKRWREALRDMHFLTKAGATLNAPLYRKISDCYHSLGDNAKAYCYMDTARMWTDSLAAKDIEEKLAEFSVKYETKEKEMQLAEERSENAIQRTKWLTALLVAVLVIAILVVVLIVVRNRHKLHLIFLRQCAELNKAQQYIDGLETERTRMARELHDGIANGLLGVTLKLQAAKTPEEMHALISDIENLRNEVRTLSHGLMPPEFTKHTLTEILGLYIDGLKNTKVTYSTNGSDTWGNLSEDTSLEVFRIAQECISNALTHSNANSIKVCLTMSADNSTGTLLVEDDGELPESVADTPGIGTRVMQERAKTIGGSIDIQNNTNGTSVSLIFPI